MQTGKKNWLRGIEKKGTLLTPTCQSLRFEPMQKYIYPTPEENDEARALFIGILLLEKFN